MERVLRNRAWLLGITIIGIAGFCFAAGLRLGRSQQTLEKAKGVAPSDVVIHSDVRELEANTPLFRFAFVPQGMFVQDEAPTQEESIPENEAERDPNDPRELLPVPSPGNGEGGGPPEECGIYLYQDGQYYQLQPGQLPGGEGSPELIPLNPVPGGPGNPGSPGRPSAPPPPPGIES
ncbi:MAG: hypothetical protein ACRCYY_07375 [Trueperaceae bacterium]